MFRNVWIVFLSLALVGPGATSFAQTTTATLTGTVTDPNNAAIPNAQVALVENATGIKHLTQTNEAGDYLMPALPPGVYTVSFSASGFAQTSAVTTLRLQQTQRLDVSLKIGTGTETVKVSASTQELQTETHDVVSTLASETIQQLPSVNNVIQVLTTTPNFSQDTSRQTSTNNASLFFGVGSLSASIGGLDYGFTEFLQDGVVNTSLMTATANMQPDVGGVSEVGVTQNGADARYSSPSVVNIITKSGANRIHGMAYDFVMNDDLNAQGEIKQAIVPPLRYNQFGANVGGAFLKNKLFYFLDYSGLRESAGRTVYAWVPTAAEEGGDFSADPYTIYDPATYNPTTGAISAFPENKIPKNRISQIAAATETYLPPPSSTPTGVVTANYARPAADTNIYNAYIARLDGVIGSKDNFYAAWESTNPVNVTANAIAINSGKYINKDTNVYAQETHVISPQLVNIARVGYNRNNLQETLVIAGTQDFQTQFGIQNLNPAPEQRVMPGIGFTLNNGSGGTGASPFAPQGDIQNLLQFDDELSWTRGKHAVYVGVDVRHSRFQGNWVVYNNGAFQFNGQYTSDHTPAGLATEAQHGFADLLLGYPWYVLGATGNSTGDFREYDLQPYIQDNWHVTPKLTLNLGLRYDFYQSPWDRNGNASTYDITTNTIHVGPTAQNLKNFDPRVGFAYGFTKDSTIHGGYGYYDAPIVYDELFFMMASPPNFYLQGGFPGLANPTSVANLFVAHPTGSALQPYVTAPKLPTQRVEQWNLGYERAIGSSWIASFSYLGSKLTHQEMRTNPNMRNEALTPGQPQVRPYPWVGDAYEIEDIGFAFYTGLVAQINRTFRNGLFLNASYTYMNSKDSDSGATTNIEHANNPRLDYALSDFNATNTFKVNAIYELPIGPGKTFLNRPDWFTREVVGGWQVSGVFNTRSGYPLNTYATDNSGTGANHAQYADEIVGCNPNTGFTRSKTKWFNTACFTVPAVGRLGNEPRNDIHGPRYTDTDISAFKSFAIREGMSVQYRSDFFNAFNHVNYYLPASNISQPASFGQILSYGPARIIQMSLKLIF